MLIKAKVLSQILNKFYRFQQIANQGKVNVQRQPNRKNNCDILIFLDIYVFSVFFFFAGYKYPIFCN